MFHTILTLVYIIPNIYVFLRIWKLFIDKAYKLHYTLVYLLTASVYPLSNLFSDEATFFPDTILNFAAGYLLPFYLYLFLFVLISDIILLANRILKIVPGWKFETPRFKIAGLLLILFLSVSVILAGAINFNTIRTSEYRIEIAAGSSHIDSLKIAFAADFHLKTETNIHFVERFVDKIRIIDPDILLFGGDIVDDERENDRMKSFEKLLKGLSFRYGAYSVLGNHEHYSGQDEGRFFPGSGIKVLRDTVVVIDNAFILAGRNDSHLKGRKTIDELLQNVPDSLPVIIVDHRPSEIEEVSKTIADVQLSGHTHNGQLFPLNFVLKKMNTLSWGYKKFRNTHFFVTSGIRLWGPPVRTTGKSEIMVIKIIFGDNADN